MQDAYTVIPPWADNIVNFGWWMHERKSTSRRLFAVLLMPTRCCCSAFCALGSLMAGSRSTGLGLTWEEFCALKEGEQVYMLVPHKEKKTPVVAETKRYNEKYNGRNVQVISTRKKAVKGLSVFLMPENFASYQVSLKQHASVQRLGGLAKVGNFLKGTVEGFQENWLESGGVETLIVTNKASWRRQSNDIRIRLKNRKNDYCLQDLLAVNETYEGPYIHTLLASPGSQDISRKSPLVIMDGPEALASYESINTSSIVVMLTHSEYENETRDILSMLGSYREESLLPDLDGVGDYIPPGSEIMLFALPVME